MANADEPGKVIRTVPTQLGYYDVILRGAADPNTDIVKLRGLCDLQEALEIRFANREFNESMSAAQGEMTTISADANNPQTRSRYAKYATLDRAIRPIYTRYGFALSYDTEPTGDPNVMRVIGLVSKGAIVRRHQVDMPIVTTGIRGGDMMSRTHATSSAISYGKRTLLTMIFNLSTADDDGNRASGYQRQQQQTQTVPPVDPATGKVAPHTINGHDNETGEALSWQQWGASLIAGIRTATTEDEIQKWLDANKAFMTNFKTEAGGVYKMLEAAITKHKEEIRAKGKGEAKP